MKNEIKDSAIFHPDGPSNEKQEMLKYAGIKKILSLITSRLNLRAFYYGSFDTVFLSILKRRASPKLFYLFCRVHRNKPLLDALVIGCK